MNDFGWVVLGASARVTAFGLVGLASAMLLRHRGPAFGALVTSTTMAVVVALSLAAPCPWPRWWSPIDRTESARVVEAPPIPESTGGARPSPTDLAVAGVAKLDSQTGPGLAEAFLQEFRREVEASARPSTSARWRWPAWAGVAFLAGLALAMARLGLGLWAVRSLGARSRAILDPDLIALVDQLRLAMGLRRAVGVRESTEVGTPATIGWLRPVLLLPPDWPTWDDRERRAVLAHELAHVLRGDYLAGLAAQLGLSLHFYHPLVHALAHRLRLQQELAADAWGARLAGGRRTYLATLANLALRQPPRPSAWPARPFLPTRGTFLRRIEMLRDPNAIQQPTLPRRGQFLTVLAILAAGLAVAGLRMSSSSSRALAQDAPARKGTPPAGDVAGDKALLDPIAVSSDVHFVLDVRPAELLKNPEIKRLVDALPADGPKAPKVLASGEIAQFLALGFERAEAAPPPNPGVPPQFAFVFRANAPKDWAEFLPPNLQEIKADGITYFRAANSPGSTCFRRLDDRTLLIGTEADAKFPPIGLDRPKGRHGWDDAWKKLGPGPIRLACDAPWLNRLVQPVFQEPGRPVRFSPIKTVIGPLLEKAQAHAMTLGIADGLTLDALATTGTDKDAERVADTLRAALTLARNALPDLRGAAEKGPPDAARSLVEMVDAVDAMLETAKVDAEKGTARLHAKADPATLAAAARMLAPAIGASREAARRAQCVNNLKQIALAMHNYHSVHDCFPPAVLYGPDGKTPHSWRVAILPYLEANDIYSRYKFDEPWDGPNNSKLIPLMPPVYGHPGSAPNGMTAYFVPTGPETLFPPRKEGMKISEITDGTHNTIMAFEAVKDVPWTKPEDIAFNATNPLGVQQVIHPGGFNVSFADGAVRFLSLSIDPQLLRAMFTRNGGEVIRFP